MESKSIEQVPILHVRGTHYTVGYSIGRTYHGIINKYINTIKYLSDTLLPIYATEKGRQIYDRSVELCQRKYPQYIQEMQGMADGAEIPFHQIMLLHIESMIAPPVESKETYALKSRSGSGSSDFGCTSVLCNNQDQILGHTEDACPEVTNNFFIVCAHIVNEQGETLEKFSTLTYPASLPGATMGFNQHGIVYSVNTVYPCQTYEDRTPVNFIARALLAARNQKEVMDIIKDAGTGIADGFSLNLFFVKDPQKGDGDEVEACNIEIGPNRSNGKESEIDVHWVKQGTSYVHCNKYLRLDIPVQARRIESSCRRHKAIEKANPPNSLENVRDILSDRSDSDFPVFRSAVPLEATEKEIEDKQKDTGKTIAVGLFDIKRRTWSLYTEPPSESEPIVEIPLIFNF